VKLRAIFRRMIESVWCLFLPGHGERFAAVQIHFVGRAARSFLITYKPAHKAKNGKETPRKVITGSWREDWASHVSGPVLDLRDFRFAQHLEKELAANGGLSAPSSGE
jgi:hypothetical protein